MVYTPYEATYYTIESKLYGEEGWDSQDEFGNGKRICETLELAITAADHLSRLMNTDYRIVRVDRSVVGVIKPVKPVEDI